MLKVQCEELLCVCKEYLVLLFADNYNVRKKLMSQLLEIADAAGKFSIMDEVLPFFLGALSDIDSSVRLAALERVPSFITHKSITPGKLKEMMSEKLINALLEDDDLQVREAASGVIMEILWQIRGTDKEFQDLVVHVMEKFFNDESGVRANFCFSLERALNLCGEETFVNHFLPLIPKLQEDVKWRVRAGVLQHIPLFARLYAAATMTEEDLLKFFETAFKDPVSEVREKGITYVKGLVNTLGPN